MSRVGETRVITCAQPGSLKSLELCQESSMVNLVTSVTTVFTKRGHVYTFVQTPSSTYYY